MATIVIDAGHGGYDYGAVNGSRYEKNDNLRMANAVAEILQGCGQNVVLTRPEDTFVTLNDRSRISNALNPAPAMFVSFHRNSSTNNAATGLEVFTRVGASAANTQYAQNVLSALASTSGLVNRGVKQENFSVLRYTNAPSMLIELGFISNDSDNALFDSRFGANAQAAANAILSSLGLTCGPATPPPSSGRDAVRNIQQWLNTTYGAGLVVDGLTGPATRRALVRALQIQLNAQYGAGLSTDGIFGPRTKAAIRSLHQGERGNLVRILQSELVLRGYNIVPDGIYGPATAQAVRSFQASQGIAADGIAGPNTFERLMR